MWGLSRAAALNVIPHQTSNRLVAEVATGNLRSGFRRVQELVLRLYAHTWHCTLKLGFNQFFKPCLRMRRNKGSLVAMEVVLKSVGWKDSIIWPRRVYLPCWLPHIASLILSYTL